MLSTVLEEEDSLTLRQVPILMLLYIPHSQREPSSLGMILLLLIVTHLHLILFSFSSINNKLGSRLTLLLGTTGYSLYIGSYL